MHTFLCALDCPYNNNNKIYIYSFFSDVKITLSMIKSHFQLVITYLTKISQSWNDIRHINEMYVPNVEELIESLWPFKTGYIFYIIKPIKCLEK